MDPSVLVRGICYDEKSSFMKGPSGAPALIREALGSGAMNAFTESLSEIRKELLTDVGDFDNDGYPDLVTGGRLFRNPAGPNHWLKVQLVGGGKVNAWYSVVPLACQ